MELDGIGVKDPPVEGCRRSVTVYFLVSCFCDWICKPGTERRQRGQSADVRQCHTNQDSVLLPRIAKECACYRRIGQNQCGLSEKRGHETSAQGLAVSLQTHQGAKTSAGSGYSVSTRAARHYGYDFGFKRCASNGGANLKAVDTRAERTGLNLHFILVILFSTNKLTPEKT